MSALAMISRSGSSCASPVVIRASINKEQTYPEESTTLPLEIFFNIMSLLNLNDLNSASRVCRRWNWIMKDDDTWGFLSRKYLLKSREEYYKKIAHSMGSNDNQRNAIYLEFLKIDVNQYSEFEREFNKIIERISLKRSFIYNYFIDSIKEINSELKTNKNDNLIRKFEIIVSKLLLSYINDPEAIMYLNTVNYSGYLMTVIKMDDNLEMIIKSAFYDGGAAIFTIAKEKALEDGRIPIGSTISGEKLVLPKYKMVFSYEPLKQALEIYISQKRPSKKRHAPHSD